MTELRNHLLELERLVEDNDRSRIPELAEMLSPRPDRFVDESVCWALGRLCGPSEIPLLETLLVQSPFEGGRYLAQALLRLGSADDHRRLVALLLERHFSLGSTLGSYDMRFPELLPFVEPYCKSPNWRIRSEAVAFVDRQKKPVPETPAMASEPTGELCQLAATGDPAAIDPILKALDTLGERHEAARALEFLLDRAADRLPTAALKEVAARPTWLLDVWRFEHEFGFAEGMTPVDLSHAKQRAREELGRR
jgi:hypothetical protein